MADTVNCEMHDETEQTFVCTHLTGDSAGLGFNSDELTDEDPHPDAWCDDCEIIRAAHDGWTDESEKLVKITLLCAVCYERTRIRNTRPSITLDYLSSLRWKCGTCEEWHTGPALDFGYDQPFHWMSSYNESVRWSILPSGDFEKPSSTFLDKEYCAINDEFFFVRGLILLPIIGTPETFCWGVWGSLSRQNFEALLRADATKEAEELPAM
ncbi:MAG: DUF2199 domain-containing protein, partial [Bryobacteraceae bacterium]